MPMGSTLDLIGEIILAAKYHLSNRPARDRTLVFGRRWNHLHVKLHGHL